MHAARAVGVEQRLFGFGVSDKIEHLARMRQVAEAIRLVDLVAHARQSAKGDVQTSASVWARIA